MRNVFFLTAFLCLLLCGGVSARDVDLDGIYIKKRSPYLTRLSDSKLDLFAAAGAVSVENNVSFAGWVSGSKIVFIRDNESSAEVVEYLLSSRKSRVIASVPGAVVHARIPSNSRFVYMTMLMQGRNQIPDSFLTTVNIVSGEVCRYKSKSVYIDYSLSSSGESYIREEKDAVYEIFPETGKRRKVLPRETYARYLKKDSSAIAVPSPDFRRMLILSGGGGSYDCAVFENGNFLESIEGVTSPADLAWINNRQIAFREGGPGHYAVAVHDCSGKSSFQIGGRTMNTNISFCGSSGILSFLSDGAVSFWKQGTGTEVWPIEGEDPVFSPGGNSFCVLYGGRLFVVQREIMKARSVEMKRAAAKILSIYQSLSKTSADWENSYSGEFIRRKVSLYEKLTGLK